MEYWSSFECHQSILKGLLQTAEQTDPTIRSIILEIHSETVVEFNYIPIVMPEESVDRYPPRVEVDKKSKKFYFSPQLSYQTFLSDNLNEKTVEYLSGLLMMRDKLNRHIGHCAVKKLLGRIEDEIEKRS